MKVLHLCSDFYNMYGNLMRREVEAGIDLSVFQFISRQKRIVFREPYLKTVQCFNEPDRYIFTLKEKKVYAALHREYDLQSFDFVHAHTIFSNGYIAWKIKQEYNIPYIVAVVNTDINIFFRRRPYLKPIGLAVLAEAERIIFHSPAYLEFILKKYIPARLREGIRAKSQIIPIGIEKIFHDQVKPHVLPANPRIKLLTVSNINRNKNHLTVCTAAEKLIKMGCSVEYTVIGKPLEKKTLAMISKKPYVKYFPYMTQQELIDQYRAHDIFVMPSIYETFGMVFAEAMSQGLPIIYSQGQGFDGQFANGLAGYSVRATDSEAIAQAILVILGNYEEISRRCTELVKKFDWDNITQQYIALYRILERKKE